MQKKFQIGKVISGRRLWLERGGTEIRLAVWFSPGVGNFICEKELVLCPRGTSISLKTRSIPGWVV